MTPSIPRPNPRSWNYSSSRPGRAGRHTAVRPGRPGQFSALGSELRRALAERVAHELARAGHGKLAQALDRLGPLDLADALASEKRRQLGQRHLLALLAGHHECAGPLAEALVGHRDHRHLADARVAVER